MLTIIYMEMLQDEDNRAAVNQILVDFFNMDQGSPEEYQANIQKIQVLKDLGEDEILDAVLDDLKDDDRYSDFV